VWLIFWGVIILFVVSIVALLWAAIHDFWYRLIRHNPARASMLKSVWNDEDVRKYLGCGFGLLFFGALFAGLMALSIYGGE